jgi:hypothetical protein
MELLKVILDFIAKIANALVVCCLVILFKPQLGNILQRVMGILKNAEEGRQDLQLPGGFGVTNLSEAAALQVKKRDLPSAAKIIQKLLSPAAPLVVGYVENFVARMKKGEDGIQFKLLDERSLPTASIFTIYIPHELTDEETSSTNLVQAKYPEADIQKISIESNTQQGRTLTGFAIRIKDQLLPVDVPQTLTSIRLVFKFREDQLKMEANMGTEQIKKLESDNLDEFADILEDRIKKLEMSKCVRVIRDPSHLYRRVSKAV